MRDVDALIVGGGPAGSTCAWKLKQAGLEPVVLDRAEFPRLKLCAGWVTPEAIHDLELDVDDYPCSFMTFETLHLHWKRLKIKHATSQHSIRRYEFDDYLLRRSGAEVLFHKVRHIERQGERYVVDGQYRSRYLVGAAGTACPVYRELFHGANPRAKSLQTATYEYEFPYDWDNGECHLWFFQDGIPGYAWYVPKADGHVNIGLGGMAEKLRHQGRNVQDYWTRFVAMLDRHGFIDHAEYRPKGYSYYLRGDVDVVRIDNAYIVGDAVGLATRDMCEGIGPAVKSGILAADSIVNDSEYSLEALARYSGTSYVSRLLERQFTA